VGEKRKCARRHTTAKVEVGENDYNEPNKIVSNPSQKLKKKNSNESRVLPDVEKRAKKPTEFLNIESQKTKSRGWENGTLNINGEGKGDTVKKMCDDKRSFSNRKAPDKKKPRRWATISTGGVASTPSRKGLKAIKRSDQNQKNGKTVGQKNKVSGRN